MTDIVNGRCYNEKAPKPSPPLIQHGRLVLQAHHIGWLVSGCFTLVATAISFWLMNKHLQWYTNKAEQRYIVRILLMVPIYATVSFSSYLFWNHSTPLLLLRDCYESTVLTSFFYLLLVYVSPDPEEQKEIFRKHGLSRFNDRMRIANGEQPRKWVFPLSSIKSKPEDGLYFLQMMKWGVLQYCLIRPATTLAAIILDYRGLYCEDSWSPGWGHIYITVIVSVSVSVSMYCLIQLYMPVSAQLAPHKPLLKLFAIKAVVFLTFWQASFLSLLATFGLVKDTEYMTKENINIGIGAIIETVEMTLFALLHLKAFSYKPYVVPPLRTKRLRALLHAFNFGETLRELWAGIVYIWHHMLGHETDVLARRQGVLEGVFGKSRIEIQGGSRLPAPNEKRRRRSESEKNSLGVQVAVEETVHIEQERQWLGVGDDYAYGLGYHTRRARERSEGLEEQIERELAARGYARRQPSNGLQRDLGYGPLGQSDLGPDPRPDRRKSKRDRSSWWRNVYNRLSQSEPIAPVEIVPVDPPLTALSRGERRSQRRNSRHRLSKRTAPLPEVPPQAYDDPPPTSAIRKYRERKSRSSHGDATQPLLQEPFPALPEFVPPELPPPSAHIADGEVQRPQLPTVYELRSPHNSAASLPSNSSRTDSFFARAFAAGQSDVSFSTDSLGGATSNHSHYSQVQLTVGPEVVTTGNRKPVTRKPVRYSAPAVPPAIFLDTRVEQPLPPLPTEAGPAQSFSPPHRRHTAEWDGRLQESMVYDIPVPAPRRSFVPRREQIVFPAPLGPSFNAIAPASPPTRYAPAVVAHTLTGIPDYRNAVPGTHTSAPRGQVRGATTLRRSQHTNMRRYSHAFVQQPPSPSVAPRRSSRRFSAPLHEYPVFEGTEMDAV